MQVLTAEEQQQLAEQTRQQNGLQWLRRRQELNAEATQAQAALQQALLAQEAAAPQLAALQTAQPAEQLRPLWSRLQEHSSALAQTRRQVEEVNTRLQHSLRRRAGIRRLPNNVWLNQNPASNR